MMGKLNTILDYFKRKKKCIKFVEVWSSIVGHMQEYNSTLVVLFEIFTLSSIPNLSNLVIWIL
jgi:hypothetical protein